MKHANDIYPPMPTEAKIHDFDPEHPIPYVESIDYISNCNDGGLALALIIGRPLEADERSTKRLAQKLKNYLGFIERQKARHCGGTFRITAYINADSDEQAVARLMQHSVWFTRSCVDFVVKKMDRNKTPVLQI